VPGGAGAASAGARALVAYPLDTEGRAVVDNELYVGAYQGFADLGVEEVGRPTKRRVVVRRQLCGPASGPGGGTGSRVTT
jgi:hypothetical protein